MKAITALVLPLFLGCGEMTPQLLPAYAHNDYLNPRPLVEALELGYRGVEADYYVVGGQLLLSHEKEDVDPEVSLRSVYLDPLRERIALLECLRRRHGLPAQHRIQGRGDGHLRGPP